MCYLKCNLFAKLYFRHGRPWRDDYISNL